MRGILWFAVRTVGQMLIAKDEIHSLAGEHLLSLGSRRVADHIGGKAIERANEGLANFQLGETTKTLT